MLIHVHITKQCTQICLKTAIFTRKKWA